MDRKYNKPILRNAYRYVYARKGNCLIGITGRVITGKSHFAIHLGSDFDPKFIMEESLVYSVEELINQSLTFIKYKGKPLTFEFIREIPNTREWLQANIKDIRITPGKVLIFDEAGTGAYVREFFSKDNKTISKIIQIWRILRMLVIIVVPEDLRLAESTITRFLNIEVFMQRIDDNKKEATCVAWTYQGWNKKTKEPIKRRIKGCRYGGKIHVKPLPKKLADEYEKVSHIYKIEALVQMGKQYKIDKPGEVGATRSIWDDVQYVKSHIADFKNEKGKVTIPMIRARLRVSLHKAQEIRTHVLSLSLSRL